MAGSPQQKPPFWLVLLVPNVGYAWMSSLPNVVNPIRWRQKQCMSRWNWCEFQWQLEIELPAFVYIQVSSKNSGLLQVEANQQGGSEPPFFMSILYIVHYCAIYTAYIIIIHKRYIFYANVISNTNTVNKICILYIHISIILPHAEDTAYVQDMLLEYASGIASEISRARDQLRKSGGNLTDSAQDDTWLEFSEFPDLDL